MENINDIEKMLLDMNLIIDQEQNFTHDLLKDSDGVTNPSLNIKESIEEQSEGSKKILKSINFISQSVEDNVDFSEHLMKIANTLKDQIDGLYDIVDKFKLKENV